MQNRMYSVANRNGRGKQGLRRKKCGLSASGMGTREHRVAKGRKPKAKHQGKEVEKNENGLRNRESYAKKYADKVICK